MKHIGTKLFLGFISMAALTILVLWIIQGGFMSGLYQQQRIASVREGLLQAGLSDNADYAALAEELNVSLIVMDAQGNTAYRSQDLPMIMRTVRAAAQMIPGQADGTPLYIQSMSGTSRYVILGQETADGQYLFGVFSLADLDAASRTLNQQLWIITVVLVVLSVILAVFLSGKMAKPIRAVTDAARDLAAGHMDVRLRVKSKDEIGQLTEALNDLGEELGRTEKLRRELISNVSHELRSPLAVIQGYAETVRDVTWPNEAKRTEQLNIIVSEASRLSRVVRDILDYSRLEAGVGEIRLSNFTLCPLFEQLRNEYEGLAAERRLAIHTACPETEARFDRDRFEQVMHNLLSNALNHADVDSVVDVAAEERDGRVRVEVRNRGADIPPDELSRIWERYYRAGHSGSGEKPLGTGLGLAIVRSILEKHGVSYGAVSENGLTVFWFETVRR